CVDRFSTALLYKKRPFPVNAVNVNFFEKGRQHFLLLPLDCHTAEPNELVNGGRSPFILTVDMGGRLCYIATKQGDQLFTVDRLWLSHYLVMRQASSML
ncbi:MAG: hypothetical protein Q4A54_09385, partial [Parabacteroides sp.]|nr:hypothetical protein [Parabacteroides sp.]